jgi:hypothetical protein
LSESDTSSKTTEQQFDEPISWIDEIEEAISLIDEITCILSSDEYGKELANVQALLLKHETNECKLAALDDKFNVQMRECYRLAQAYKGARDLLNDKLRAISK